MDYKQLITRDDFLNIMLKRGYDFTDTSILVGIHFPTQEDAIDDFFQNAFDTIYELIRENRGNGWTKLFYEDMVKDLSDNPKALEFKTALIEAIVEQTIFYWDNGDRDAIADSQDTRVNYSPKAIRKLWEIILRG